MPKKGGSGPWVAVLAVVALLVVGGGGYYFLNSSGREQTKAGGSGTPVAAQPSGGAPSGGLFPITGQPPATSASLPAAPTVSGKAPQVTPIAAHTPIAVPSPTPAKPNLGAASFKAPTQAKLIQTKDWGHVPANQIGIVLKDGLKRPDAEQVARGLGASVVGEFAYINLYQVETAGASETDLKAAVDRAKGATGVELAFPLQPAYMDVDIKGQRCSVLNDSVYGGENAKPYQMIGVQEAWNIIRVSGAALSTVEVGVTDNGLYKGNDEFGGKSKVAADGEDAIAQPENQADGKAKPYGTHGTAVTGIIGANPENGGMTGIASVLGDKLNVRMTNIFGPTYGANNVSVPDPNDPTKITAGAQTWAIGDLVAIKNQVEGGATIINASWGNSNADPAWAAAYKKFFEKMARDHPKVLFVCSAGNDGHAQDGVRRYPSGLNLPNMITVGALDNDGSRVHYSNMKSPNFEVTLAAPGHRVVSGVSADGRVSNFNGGTSFSTPQVTAAAAVLRSLNSALSAADIKKILVETAATETDVSGKKVGIDASVGGKVLRIDNAVLKVLKDMKKVPADATVESLQKLGVIDAVAKSDKPKEYTIVATLGGAGEKGADVKIELQGQGMISGSSTKHLDRAGEVSWGLSILDEKSTPSVKVTRLDVGSCSTINLAPVDMAGLWSGTWTLTDAKVASDITIPNPLDDKAPPTVITKEECEKSIKEKQGKATPMKMEFTPSSPEAGTVTVTTIDEEGKEETEKPWPYTVSGSQVTIDATSQGAGIRFDGQVGIEDKKDVYKGNLSITWADPKTGTVALEIKGAFSVYR